MAYEMGEEQQGFRRRCTVDGMFTLGQLMEKILEGQENIALGFIDLEKAYVTVSRDIALATLRWMGVPELKWKVLSSGITPAYLYGLEMMMRTEKTTRETASLR